MWGHVKDEYKYVDCLQTPCTFLTAIGSFTDTKISMKITQFDCNVYNIFHLSMANLKTKFKAIYCLVWSVIINSRKIKLLVTSTFPAACGKYTSGCLWQVHFQLLVTSTFPAACDKYISGYFRNI